MKLSLNKYLAITATIATLASGCAKNTGDPQPMLDNLETKAVVKVFNAAVGTARNYVYVDSKPVTGSLLTYGGQFPSAASTYGFALESGLKSFMIKDTLATSTQPALSFAMNLEGGKAYTVFMYDSVTTPKQLSVPTEIIVPSDETSRVRAAHFSYLKAGVPSPIDIFSKRKNANIFSGLAYTQVSNFISYTPNLVDTLIVRVAGSTTQNLDTLAFTPMRKRSYTLVFNGRYMTNEAGAAASPRVLSVLTNY
jgi:hypothetical protein